jgi:hypothetical protein
MAFKAVILMLKSDIPPFSSGIGHRAAEDALNYLTSYSFSESYSQDDFTASLLVARLILHVSTKEPGLLGDMLSSPSRSQLPLRAWNMLVLEALRQPLQTSTIDVFVQLSTFSQVYSATLQACMANMSSPVFSAIAESPDGDVNHAYAAVKLWILLARKRAWHQGSGASSAPLDHGIEQDLAEFRVWNEIWPPFQRLTMLSLVDGAVEESSVGIL